MYKCHSVRQGYETLTATAATARIGIMAAHEQVNATELLLMLLLWKKTNWSDAGSVIITCHARILLSIRILTEQSAIIV